MQSLDDHQSRRRSHHSTKSIVLTGIYALLFVLLFVGIFILVTRVFSIQEIKVVGTGIAVSINEKEMPKTLVFFPSEKLRKEILKDNPILADIAFQKEYPHTLVIVPILRSAVTVLKVPTRTVFLDELGYVLSDTNATGSGLPVITAPQMTLRIGQKLKDPAVTSAVSFLGAIRPIVPVETITITNDGSLKAHGANLDILFTQDSDIGALSTTLQTLLAGFRIKGTLPKKIDLRFDKPIITN